MLGAALLLATALHVIQLPYLRARPEHQQPATFLASAAPMLASGCILHVLRAHLQVKGS